MHHPTQPPSHPAAIYTTNDRFLSPQLPRKLLSLHIPREKHCYIELPEHRPAQYNKSARPPVVTVLLLFLLYSVYTYIESK